MNWLINKLGGYTQKQFDDAKQIAEGQAHLYYLNQRRVDLVTDRQAAVRMKRTRVDIDRRLKAVTAEQVSVENEMYGA